MTILTYPVHVFANGEVTPIPDWTGGETEAKVYVEQSEKDEGTFRISDLWGVGAEIWQDESVNEYIRKERDSWD